MSSKNKTKAKAKAATATAKTKTKTKTKTKKHVAKAERSKNQHKTWHCYCNKWMIPIMWLEIGAHFPDPWHGNWMPISGSEIVSKTGLDTDTGTGI